MKISGSDDALEDEIDTNGGGDGSSGDRGLDGKIGVKKDNITVKGEQKTKSIAMKLGVTKERM